ncbi:MAG: outer membrane beta-barrel protein, partial [Myxococcales bacterium]|nr:outer membrane beta-barrel protein [Myxococcales bacterium]
MLPSRPSLLAALVALAPQVAAASPFARVAPPVGADEDADGDDAVSTRGLPGAESATRGDASAAVASGATADAGAAEFQPWEVGGFVDANYSFNSNSPDNHVNRLRSAVPRTGEFALNLVVAYIRRDAVPGRTSPTFELALQAGSAADALMYYEPEPGGADSRYAGREVFKHIGRANVGVKTRRGTEISAGMHLSPVGIGIHWTPFNWNYSVSWELDAVPYYLAGLKVVHPLNERHGVQLWVVNGWQTLADTNKVPSLMLGYTYTPNPRFNLAEFAYFGPDQADVRMAAWRMYSDTQFTYNVERFGVGGLFDVGGERLTERPGRPMTLWMTAALFTRWRVLGQKRTWDMA